MKRIIIFLLLLCVLTACTRASKEVTVKSLSSVDYRGSDGHLVSVKYYSLSDDSLNFVKLLFSDGSEITLPQAVSASGARYTNDFLYTWWIKGDSAWLEKRNDDAEWVLQDEYTKKE